MKWFGVVKKKGRIGSESESERLVLPVPSAREYVQRVCVNRLLCALLELLFDYLSSCLC